MGWYEYVCSFSGALGHWRLLRHCAGDCGCVPLAEHAVEEGRPPPSAGTPRLGVVRQLVVVPSPVVGKSLLSSLLVLLGAVVMLGCGWGWGS